MKADTERSKTAPSVAEFYSDTRYEQPLEGSPDVDWYPKRYSDQRPLHEADLTSVKEANKLKAWREGQSGERESDYQLEYPFTKAYLEKVDEQHLLYTGLLASRTGKPRTQKEIDKDVELLIANEDIRVIAPNLRHHHTRADLERQLIDLDKELEKGGIPPSSEWKGYIYGSGKGLVGGATVSKNELQQMAQAAYLGREQSKVGAFKLVHKTPTLKLYQNGSLIVVAVRGTELSDASDIQADGMTLIGKLKDSNRYQKDRNELMEFRKKYPTFRHFVGVGHSLGGAILDGFIREGLIQNAVSYNPLLEPQEIRGNPRHHRIYHEDDPVYKMVGYLIPGVEVRRGYNSFWKALFAHYLPFGLETLFKAYDAHRISSFKGGNYSK